MVEEFRGDVRDLGGMVCGGDVVARGVGEGVREIGVTVIVPLCVAPSHAVGAGPPGWVLECKVRVFPHSPVGASTDGEEV